MHEVLKSSMLRPYFEKYMTEEYVNKMDVEDAKDIIQQFTRIVSFWVQFEMDLKPFATNWKTVEKVAEKLYDEFLSDTALTPLEFQVIEKHLRDIEQIDRLTKREGIPMDEDFVAKELIRLLEPIQATVSKGLLPECFTKFIKMGSKTFLKMKKEMES